MHLGISHRGTLKAARDLAYRHEISISPLNTLQCPESALELLHSHYELAVSGSTLRLTALSN